MGQSNKGCYRALVVIGIENVSFIKKNDREGRISYHKPQRVPDRLPFDGGALW